MSRQAVAIVLGPEEEATLSAWVRVRSMAIRQVRAQIIQLAAAGVESKEIARVLGVSRPTVQLWRQRFLALRLDGLVKDAPRPGRIPGIAEDQVHQIVEGTLHTKPANATHWSVRTMARAQGVSAATVQRIWSRHNFKSHLTKTFKLSRDKQFIEKLHDIVGLYLNPPDRALVLCADEKSQIQALDRTQAGLPLKKGRCGTMTHDYKRNGTRTLFAALSILDRQVIGDCMPRHRHQEFIRFLKKIDAETPGELDLHLIVDNYGTHKHPGVKSWLGRHPRFHLHFTPTSSSWLNLVERWFRDLTDKRIRRGSFESVPDLIAAINDYRQKSNQNPHVFVWTASAKSILAKIPKCKEMLETLHYEPNAVNLDITADTAPDVIHDLNARPWPFPDNRFDEVVMRDVLEHLDDTVGTLEEIHRVYRPGGRAHIIVPHFSSNGAFTDPTHKRFFALATFDYFTSNHPCNFYTRVRFVREEARLVFRPTPLNKVVWRMANRFPIQYENAWAWLFPAWFIGVILRVEKDASLPST